MARENHQRRPLSKIRVSSHFVVVVTVLITGSACFWGFSKVFSSDDIESKLGQIVADPHSSSRTVKQLLGEPTENLSGKEYLGTKQSQIDVSVKPEPPDLECSTVYLYNRTPTIAFVFFDKNDRVITIHMGKT